MSRLSMVKHISGNRAVRKVRSNSCNLDGHGIRHCSRQSPSVTSVSNLPCRSRWCRQDPPGRLQVQVCQDQRPRSAGATYIDKPYLLGKEVRRNSRVFRLVVKNGVMYKIINSNFEALTYRYLGSQIRRQAGVTEEKGRCACVAVPTAPNPAR